jgi:hypothetical protein
MNMKPSAPKDEGSTSIFPAFGDELLAINQVYPFTPEELIRKTIMREDKDGSIVRTEIVRILKGLNRHPEADQVFGRNQEWRKVC